MSLANFIDRAATAASQVLSEFSASAFKERLEQHVIAVVVDGAAAQSSEGRWTAELAVNLLARLYPRLAIVAAEDDLSGFTVELGLIAEAINPEITLLDRLGSASATLVVGETPVSSPGTTFYIGSDAWRARLSMTGPVCCGHSLNPFGAGAAAAFGAANVFRSIFADQLELSHLDAEIDLSLFDYTQGAASEADLGAVDIGEAYLVGLGAIGNGSLWALSRMQGVEGILHLIDHDPIDLSNLQRYVLTTQKHAGRRKTEIAAEVLAATKLVTKQYPMRWAEFLQSRTDWRFERVVVALDNVPDRVALQGALPKWIANAWTQELDLGVSRHGFGDGGPCLCCLYLPMGKVKDEHELIADELRLPHMALEIRTLLQTSAPVDTEFVEQVATAFGVQFDALSPFVGQPVRSFHQRAICGGLMLRLTDSQIPGAAVVPMAFQSALAGIMLAAELVKHAAGRLDATAPITRMNLLRPLAPFLRDPRGPDQTGRCICNDEDYRAIYREKYSVSESTPRPPSANAVIAA
jgi:hypothetical protein